jgi:hypothetical protein
MSSGWPRRVDRIGKGAAVPRAPLFHLCMLVPSPLNENGIAEVDCTRRKVSTSPGSCTRGAATQGSTSQSTVSKNEVPLGAEWNMSGSKFIFLQ